MNPKKPEPDPKLPEPDPDPEGGQAATVPPGGRLVVWLRAVVSAAAPPGTVVSCGEVSMMRLKYQNKFFICQHF